MIPDSFYLNCMDPGGTTGMSLFRVTPETFDVVDTAAVAYKIGPDDRVLESPLATLRAWRGDYDDLPHILLYEAFHIRPGQQATDTTAFDVLSEVRRWMTEGQAPEALAVLDCLDRLRNRLKGNAEALLVIAGEEWQVTASLGPGRTPYVEEHSQQPVQAKRLAPDAVLRKLGLYCKAHGKDSRHVNDSLRHGVAWLARLPHVPLCKKAWPPAA